MLFVPITNQEQRFFPFIFKDKYMPNIAFFKLEYKMDSNIHLDSDIQMVLGRLDEVFIRFINKILLVPFLKSTLF